MEIIVNEKKYEVIKNEKDAIDQDVLKEKITDYFYPFEYIVGDWAYGKLRLKGFYNAKSKACKMSNNIDNVDTYIKDCCAFGCRYFILKKIENK